jgi:uncharacterized membrane protein
LSRHITSMSMNGRQTTSRAPGVEQFAEAVLGGTMLGYAALRRGRAPSAARFAGTALLVAAFAPAFTRQLRRAGAARRRFHLRTTLDLDAPVHQVFEFCRDFENFARVIQSLHSITDHQDGRSHWEVISPSGELLAWDAEITKYVPNVVIAWRSLPGSVVDCNGLIRFSPKANGGTRVQLDIGYNPCHTGLTDAIHALFDVSRKDQLEADLARANFYIVSKAQASQALAAAEDSESSTASA